MPRNTWPATSVHSRTVHGMVEVGHGGIQIVHAVNDGYKRFTNEWVSLGVTFN